MPQPDPADLPLPASDGERDPKPVVLKSAELRMADRTFTFELQALGGRRWLLVTERSDKETTTLIIAVSDLEHFQQLMALMIEKHRASPMRPAAIQLGLESGLAGTEGDYSFRSHVT